MYQRRTFFEYLKKHDSRFMEMAAIRKEERIHFDDYDQKYLRQFPPELNLWMRAIMFRYSPKVLANPNQEEHDVDIQVQHKDEKSGKITQTSQKFHVKVYVNELIAKLVQAGYDPDKIDMSGKGSRSAAEQAAQKELAFYLHERDPSHPPMYVTSRKKDQSGPKEIARGTFSFPNAKAEPFELSKKWPSHLSLDSRHAIADGGKATTSRFRIGDREQTHSPTVHEPLELDDADRKFLAWFDNNNLQVLNKTGEEVPGQTIPGKQFKTRAFMMRINGQLLNDPQANTRHGDGEPGQIYRDIFFSNRGRRVVAHMVPVGATHLRARLDKWKSQGIDFDNVPIEHKMSLNWIRTGKYSPHLGQYGKGDTDKSIGVKKFSMIHKFIDEQDAYLRDPENSPSPGAFIPNLILPNRSDFDYETDWMTILDQEAQIISNRALLSVKNKVGSPDKINWQFPIDGDRVNDELKQEVLTWLTKEVVAMDKDYPDQSWRIKKGVAFAMQFVKNAIGSNHQSTDAAKDIAGDELVSKTGVGPMAEPEQLSPDNMQIVIDFLKRVPDANKLPSEDVDWEELAIEFMKELHAERYERNNGHELNDTKRVMVAKKVLINAMQELLMKTSLAAEKTPTVAKVDPATARAPEPDYSKGYVAPDDEGDDDDIKSYRLKRRFGR